MIGVLENPTSPTAEPFSRALQPAARALGLQLHVLHASTDRDFDTVFATLVQVRVDALVISPDNFFNALPRWRFSALCRQSTSIARSSRLVG